MQHSEPASDPATGPVVGSGRVAAGDGPDGKDPAEGLSILHVVVRAGATNSQYNEHCLPVRDTRRITVCSLFPAEVTVPPEVGLVEGDGSVRGCFRALREALTAATYDVVHVHAPASGVLTMLVYLRARRPRRDLVFTVHSSWSVLRRRNRLFLLAIAAYFPLLVICGTAAAESLPRRVRLLARRIEVVSNGVDIDRVDRVLAGPARAPAPGPGAGTTITSVIRTRPIKDPATLVHAFMDVAGPGDRLVLVGAPTLPRELSSAIREAGLDDRVHLPGVVPRDEVYRIFHESTLFVSTSRGEGLPVSVLEAMACRCPVVLSDIPPHRDIARLAPGIPLVPVGDVAGFRDAIAKALRMSPSRRRRVQDTLRRCVVAHFSVIAMNQAYGRLYGGVARRNGEPTPPLAARRTRRRLVSASMTAAVIGALAALGYGATHPPDYQAVTTLVVGDVSVLPTQDGAGLDAMDATTVADLARRQVVLQPVAEALDLGDWRALQRRVDSSVAGNPAYVDVTATATDPGAAERLSSAVADQVVRLTAAEAGPAPDPGFATRELPSLDVDITATQTRIDHVLRRMGSAGPSGVEKWGRRLTMLQHRLAQLQSSYQGMLTWHGDSVRSRGVAVSDLAYAQRSSWPPEPPVLAALGAFGGLGALLGMRLLFGRGQWTDEVPDLGAVTRGATGNGGRVAGSALVPAEADGAWPTEPRPTEPSPSEPRPTEPRPTEPRPTEQLRSSG